MLPLPATPAPLATAAFADPPAAPLIAEARAVLGGHGHGRAAGQRRAADDSDSEDEASFQSYDDPDDGESPIPPFTQSGTAGFQLPGYYTRGSLTTAYSFFKLFFRII